MHRLARKHRDLAKEPEKPSKNVDSVPDSLGFVIDRGCRNVDIDNNSEESDSNKRPKLDEWSINEKANENALNQLERSVFNRTDRIVQKLTEHSSESERESSDDDDSEGGEQRKVPKKQQSAWVDDDEEEERSAANREKYEQLVGQPKWAKLAEDKKNADESSDDSDDDDFRKMRQYTSTATSSSVSSDPSLQALPIGQTIQVARCADLNQELRHFSEITCIDFYPLSTLALVASHDTSLKLFQVDGKKNALVHTIVMKNWPIQRAKFNAATQEIYAECAMPQKHFYCYDLMAEKMTICDRYRSQGCKPFRKLTLSEDGQMLAMASRNGYIHLISTKSKELMFDFKRNGEIGGMAMAGNNLYASGNDGEVFVWDVRQQRRCLFRFNDSGCINGTSLAISPDHSTIACGSDSGIVNVYDLQTCSQTRLIIQFAKFVHVNCFCVFSAILNLSKCLKIW